MAKFNLSEAAKDILQGNVDGKKAAHVKPAKLSGDVSYGTKDAGDIVTNVLKTTDSAPDASKGAPTATPPGATPPVGSEPMKKLAKQPAEEGSVDQPEGKASKQTMEKNPGATFQQYEENELAGDVVSEEKDEGEGHEDEAQDKKLIKKMIKDAGKGKMKEDVDALLSGENLSEEFKEKATTIFEAAVFTRVE
jgi:hypothetical protein